MGFASLRLWLSVALIAAAAFASAGCGDAEDPGAAVEPTAPVVTTDPVKTFAPLVYLSADERYYPMGAGEFIDRATLHWSNTGTCFYDTLATGRIADRRTDDSVPRLDPLRLGRGIPYRHHPLRPRCSRRDVKGYSATKHTRPYDRRGRTPGVPLDAGFYLDLLTAAAPGHSELERHDGQLFVKGVPTYFERGVEMVEGRRALRISYWLLFGRNEPAGSFEERSHKVHEGDWERVDVLIRRGDRSDSYVPILVRLHGAGRERDVLWARLQHAAGGSPSSIATHPALLSMSGSHELTNDLDADCADCPHWQTWTRLRNALAEPWYGFGGAWGAVGGSTATTGPVGPGAHATELPFEPGRETYRAGPNDKGPPRARRQLLAILGEMRKGIYSGRPHLVCDNLTDEAISQFNFEGEPDPSGCARHVERLSASLRTGRIRWPTPRIIWVRIYGSIGGITVTEAGEQYRLGFLREGGEWKAELYFPTRPEVVNAR